MTETPVTATGLEALRRELDEIDSKMLALLAQRFAVTSQVKSHKQDSGEIRISPLRPAREAQILKRLLDQSGGNGLAPEMVLRIWRGILTQSCLSQAPITLHMGKKLAQSLGHRLRLRDHFPGMPVEEWRDEAQALMQVNASPGDICVVETESNWVEPFLSGKAGTAQVVGVLPVMRAEKVPQLLIIGNAPGAPSGNDETLIISNGNLPRDFAIQPLWQVKWGAHRITALAGFHSEHESPLVGLTRSNPSLGLKLAGRYPTSFEV